MSEFDRLSDPGSSRQRIHPIGLLLNIATRDNSAGIVSWATSVKKTSGYLIGNKLDVKRFNATRCRSSTLEMVILGEADRTVEYRVGSEEVRWSLPLEDCRDVESGASSVLTAASDASLEQIRLMATCGSSSAAERAAKLLAGERLVAGVEK